MLYTNDDDDDEANDNNFGWDDLNAVIFHSFGLPTENREIAG